MSLNLLLREGDAADLLENLGSLRGLEVALRETKVLQVAVKVQHVRQIADGGRRDGIIAQVQYLERFVSSCRIRGVWLQSLADLLHIIILNVAGSQEEDLKFGILLKPTNIMIAKLTAWQRGRAPLGSVSDTADCLLENSTPSSHPHKWGSSRRTGSQSGNCPGIGSRQGSITDDE